MRTRPAVRGRGLARRLLAAMGQAALARGIGTAFLQVEADNAAARALYARCGFVPAWRYGYWQQPR
jgi:predicted GNAT family acetyltransferase